MKRGIITLAIGRKYNEQARYLAYSLIIHSPSLPRAVITDDCEYFRELYDVLIPADTFAKFLRDGNNTGEGVNPFEMKVNIHKVSPFEETIFLDADTLVYNDLNFMFDYFSNQSIVYAGTRITSGEWYVKDVNELLSKFKLDYIGAFNSGVFLFKKDTIGVQCMDYAAYLYNNYSGVDIPFFRGNMLPDEPFLSIAFSKYGQEPVGFSDEHGRLGRSTINICNPKFDIVKGIAKCRKYNELMFCSIIHFTGTDIPYYEIEKIRLWLYYHTPLSSFGIACISSSVRALLFIRYFIRRCINYIFRHCFLSKGTHK